MPEPVPLAPGDHGADSLSCVFVTHLCYFLSRAKTKMSNGDKDQSFKALEELWVIHMDPLQVWGKCNHVIRALQRSHWEGASSLGRLEWNKAPDVGRKVIFLMLFPHLSPAVMFAWGTWNCGVDGPLSWACCPRCLSAAGVMQTFNLGSIYANAWLVLEHCSLQGIKAMSINHIYFSAKFIAEKDFSWGVVCVYSTLLLPLLDASVCGLQSCSRVFNLSAQDTKPVASSSRYLGNTLRCVPQPRAQRVIWPKDFFRSVTRCIHGLEGETRWCLRLLSDSCGHGSVRMGSSGFIVLLKE